MQFGPSVHYSRSRTLWAWLQPSAGHERVQVWERPRSNVLRGHVEIQDSCAHIEPNPEGPSTQYLRFLIQKPYSKWYLGPETLNIGYLDLLGNTAPSNTHATHNADQISSDKA